MGHHPPVGESDDDFWHNAARGVMPNNQSHIIEAVARGRTGTPHATNKLFPIKARKRERCVRSVEEREAGRDKMGRDGRARIRTHAAILTKSKGR